MDSQKNNLDVILRLGLFCSPETISLLNRIIPGIADFTSFDPFALSGKKVSLEKLSNQNLQKLGASLNKRISAGNQNLKLLMIRRLLSDANESLLHGIEILGILTGNEIASLKLFFSDSQESKIKPENALQILQKLNIFQLEFLSHPSVFQTGSSSPGVNDTNAGNNKIRQLVSKKNVVSDLINKLKTKNPLLGGRVI